VGYKLLQKMHDIVIKEGIELLWVWLHLLWYNEFITFLFLELKLVRVAKNIFKAVKHLDRVNAKSVLQFCKSLKSGYSILM